MKPSAFDYHLATSPDEAVDLLARYGGEAKVLAGGQSLVPLLALRLARVDHLIDVNRLEASTSIGDDGELHIGATVRHRRAEQAPEVRRGAPLLAAAISHVGHSAIRNRGTVGGSLAHADPAAELPAALLALEGSVAVASTRGKRNIAAADLFTGFLTTSLEPDELLADVVVPRGPEGAGWSVQEFARRSGDFAIAGALTVLRTDAAGRVDHVRIALIGVAPTPVRATEAELLVAGESPSTDLWADAGERAAGDVDPPSDLHGSSAYRRQLTAAMVRRSLAEAASRIRAAA